MAVHDNSLSDVETDLRFGRTYSFLAVLGKSLLAAFALFIISEEGIKDSLLPVAEFVDVLLSPALLALHVIHIIGAVYLAKTSSGKIALLMNFWISLQIIIKQRNNNLIAQIPTIGLFFQNPRPSLRKRKENLILFKLSVQCQCHTYLA